LISTLTPCFTSFIRSVEDDPVVLQKRNPSKGDSDVGLALAVKAKRPIRERGVTESFRWHDHIGTEDAGAALEDKRRRSADPGDIIVTRQQTIYRRPFEAAEGPQAVCNVLCSRKPNTQLICLVAAGQQQLWPASEISTNSRKLLSKSAQMSRTLGMRSRAS